MAHPSLGYRHLHSPFDPSRLCLPSLPAKHREGTCVWRHFLATVRFGYRYRMQHLSCGVPLEHLMELFSSCMLRVHLETQILLALVHSDTFR